MPDKKYNNSPGLFDASNTDDLKNKIVKQYNTVRDKVKMILEKYPETRDNDHMLVWMYWTNMREDMSVLLDINKFYKLDSWDTISRIRRKIQEENESLRGKRYYERKKLQTIHSEINKK